MATISIYENRHLTPPLSNSYAVIFSSSTLVIQILTKHTFPKDVPSQESSLWSVDLSLEWESGLSPERELDLCQGHVT